MLKKTIFSLILITLFMNSFNLFSETLSQPNIRVRAIKNENHIYIRVLTPTNVKYLNAEIYSKDDELKAVIRRDFYGIIEEGGTFHEFIISSDTVDFTEEDIIKLYPRTTMEETMQVSAIPYKAVSSAIPNLEKPLKVMSYNIHRGQNKIGYDTLRDIREFIEREDPDIIGIQELDNKMIRTNFKDQIKELAEELSMYYVYGPNINILKGEYGNGILSKYPIVDSKNIKMDGKETRGLLWGKVLIEGEEVNFFVTHLGLNEKERENQTNIIKPYISMYRGSSILVGDFNALDDEPIIQNLGAIMRDTGLETSNRFRHTLNIFRAYERIDYVFVPRSSTIIGYRVPKVEYSDHFPVIAEIMIKNP